MYNMADSLESVERRVSCRSGTGTENPVTLAVGGSTARRFPGCDRLSRRLGHRSDQARGSRVVAALNSLVAQMRGVGRLVKLIVSDLTEMQRGFLAWQEDCNWNQDSGGNFSVRRPL
jgi:hypothetical protein